MNLKKFFPRRKILLMKLKWKESIREREGILVDRFKITLDGNSMRGEAKLKSFSNPEYSIKLSGVGFEANAMKRDG